MTPYRGGDEGLDCAIHAACNVMFLLLGESSSAYEVSRLHRSITLASARCRPHTEGRPEVSDLLKLGHLGPIFQNAGTFWYPKNDYSSSRTSAVDSLSFRLVIRQGILWAYFHHSLIRNPCRGSCDRD